MEAVSQTTDSKSIQWMKIEYNNGTIFFNTTTRKQTDIKGLPDAERDAIALLFNAERKRQDLVVTDAKDVIITTDTKCKTALLASVDEKCEARTAVVPVDEE